MGGELVNSPSPVSFTEIFYKQFPFYLSIGMTSFQYWEEDCTLTKYYRQAYELKQKRKNEELWRQGAYFYDALCVVASNVFAKKGAAPLEYSNSPYPLNDKELKEKQENEERLKMEKIKAKLTAFAINSKNSFDKKE